MQGTYPTDNPQSAVDSLRSPTPRKINDPKRPYYPSTPNLSKDKTPDKNPAATTHFPVKAAPSGTA